MTTDIPVITPKKTIDDIVDEVVQSQTPWVVMLHNDDHNDMHHVVEFLMKAVTTLSENAALLIMLEAHTQGVAIVGSWRLELCEYYRDRIQTFSLTATIERS